MSDWLALKSMFSLHAGYSPRALKNKLKMLVQVAKNRAELKLFLSRMSSALGEAGFKRLGADCLGVVHWPYISKSWRAGDRLGVLASHYEVVTTSCPQLLLYGRDDRLVLSDLSAFSAHCSLVLDRPIWFMREGELVLNLFQEDLRIASIAFTLCRVEGALCLFIGAVQGIHKGVESEKSLGIYRDLTKDFEGLRPRSFLIEVIKYIATHIGVQKIYAVGDGYRHHRHPYFGASKAQELLADYDSIWLEHGATPSEREDFFEIPMAPSRKPLDAIASKKRAMYRRRYELLDSTFAQVDQVLKGCHAANRAQGSCTTVQAPAVTTLRTDH